MLPLSTWPLAARRQIIGVFTDIDDTLTTDGAITADALNALGALKTAGLHVVAITGRPVGWSVPFVQGDHARGLAPWPVDALVAENGSVALFLDKSGPQSPSAGHSLLSKLYQQDVATRLNNRTRMQQVAAQIMRDVPGATLSRDAGGRETDLAFDHAEFAHLNAAQIAQVTQIMQQAGMTTSISSIHLHGCFGNFNKWMGALWVVKELLGRDLAQELNRWVFVGDSGNDQAMFEHFTHSVGVANIRRCESQLTHLPTYVTQGERGAGFTELANTLLQTR